MAAIKSATRTIPRLCGLSSMAVSLGAVSQAQAQSLPDDHAEMQWHDYSGGGVTETGPEVQVSQHFGNSVALRGDVLTDSITSASIDVLTQPSARCGGPCRSFKERRSQGTLAADVLQDKSLVSGGITGSSEPDYKSRTAFADVSESLPGNLTTISFGFSRSWDRVGQHQGSGGTTWLGDAERRAWRASITEILTQRLVAGLKLEVTGNDGYLANPYIKARYLLPGSTAVGWENAVVPGTRTGTAVAANMSYAAPWRGDFDGSYRYYHDSWRVTAHTAALGYGQGLTPVLSLSGHVRYYRQSAAVFYSDLLPFYDSQDFLSRDQSLAQFHRLTIGAGATFEFHPDWSRQISAATLNVRLDRTNTRYNDFTNLLAVPAGDATASGPKYGFNATVLQVFLSVFY